MERRKQSEDCCVTMGLMIFYLIQVRYSSFTSISCDIFHQILARFYVTRTYFVSLFVEYNNYKYLIFMDPCIVV